MRLYPSGPRICKRHKKHIWIVIRKVFLFQKIYKLMSNIEDTNVNLIFKFVTLVIILRGEITW
jgi:hypothetical protein